MPPHVRLTNAEVMSRVLLRNFETGEFFQTAALWTKEPNEALNFENRAVAATVARELGLQNAEIVYVSADGKLILETRLDIDP
jgi:hypothetical protein